MKRIALMISAVLCSLTALWTSSAGAAEKAVPKVGDPPRKTGREQQGSPLVNRAKAKASGDPHVNEEPTALKKK